MQQSELVVWTAAVADRYKHDSCAICHEAFNPSGVDICRVLDCAHVFHAKCVDLWFIKATFCPLCKSDLKLTHRAHSSSQRSLGQYSQTSSHRSLGTGSQSSSLRSGQILVGHSNSDPALLRILGPQEHPRRASPPPEPRGTSPGFAPHFVGGSGGTPSGSPDRQPSGASLGISWSDRSLPATGAWWGPGPLQTPQEEAEESRADSQRSQSSNSPSTTAVDGRAADVAAAAVGQERLLLAAGPSRQLEQLVCMGQQASAAPTEQARFASGSAAAAAVASAALGNRGEGHQRTSPIAVQRGHPGVLGDRAFGQHQQHVVFYGSSGTPGGASTGTVAAGLVASTSSGARWSQQEALGAQAARSRSSSVPPAQQGVVAGLCTTPGAGLAAASVAATVPQGVTNAALPAKVASPAMFHAGPAMAAGSAPTAVVVAPLTTACRSGCFAPFAGAGLSTTARGCVSPAAPGGALTAARGCLSPAAQGGKGRSMTLTICTGPVAQVVQRPQLQEGLAPFSPHHRQELTLGGAGS